jgi:uncharacterized repeat protein (TIGR01451 family)
MKFLKFSSPRSIKQLNRFNNIIGSLQDGKGIDRCLSRLASSNSSQVNLPEHNMDIENTSARQNAGIQRKNNRAKVSLAIIRLISQLGLLGLAWTMTEAAMANQIPTTPSGTWNGTGTTAAATKDTPSGLKTTISVSGSAMTMGVRNNTSLQTTNTATVPTLPAATNGMQVLVTANSSCVNTSLTCNNLGTVTFNFTDASGNPIKVKNPVIHMSRLGGALSYTFNGVPTSYYLGAVLSLTTPATGASLGIASGARGFTVAGNKISPDLASFPTTALSSTFIGDCTVSPNAPQAGCGSIPVTGLVSSLSFNVDLLRNNTSGSWQAPITPFSWAADGIYFTVSFDEDYGDAPASYDPTTAASHIISDLTLGATIDADNTGVNNGGATGTTSVTPSPNAVAASASNNGTNGDGADEDAVSTFPALTTSSTTYALTVPISGASNAGQVCGWIDLNRNNVFDTTERACSSFASGATSVALNWTGLSGLTAGNNYVRLRASYDTTGVQNPTGRLNSGEVEDYQLAITAPSADLATTKTGPTSAVAGSTVTYNLSTVNNGPSTAANVIITDNIGTGLTGVVVSNSGIYNSATGIVTFPTIASLAKDATQNYTISLTAPSSGSITDTVSSTSATTDPTPANNNGSATNAIVTTAITPSADLITTKTGPASAVAGSTVTYNLSTVNNGPSAAANVVVTDNIGTGLTGVVVSNSGIYNSATGIVTFPTIASLANGATQTYTISLTAPSSGSITDTVSSISATADPTPTNNNGSSATAIITTTITPSADLVTTKTGPATAVAGSTVTYTLNTLNNGPSAATNVIITDNIGIGLTGVNPSDGGIYNPTTGIVTFPPVTALANTVTQTYTISLTAPTSGSITDTVSSTSSTGDPNASNNNGTAVAANVVTTISAPTITLTPNVILVKRITAMTGIAPIGGDNVTAYKDENGTPSGAFNNPYDDNDITVTTPTTAVPADTNKWPNPVSGFLIGAVNAGQAASKEIVEYTIYFLSAGSSSASNVSVCDRIPANQTFVPDAYNSLTPATAGATDNRGIAVSIAAAAPLGYTNLTDGDTGEYFAPGITLPGVCGAEANTTGAVVVNLGTGATNALGGTVPNATAPATAGSYGFIRFKAKTN